MINISKISGNFERKYLMWWWPLPYNFPNISQLKGPKLHYIVNYASTMGNIIYLSNGKFAIFYQIGGLAMVCI